MKSRESASGTYERRSERHKPGVSSTMVMDDGDGRRGWGSVPAVASDCKRRRATKPGDGIVATRGTRRKRGSRNR